MIDIDKYEGCIADMKGYDLAILAEELLVEVKRLSKLRIAEEDELEKLSNRAIFYEDEYNSSKRENQVLLKEVEQLYKKLGDYMRFQLWVQEKHNEIHDSYEEIDEL